MQRIQQIQQMQRIQQIQQIQINPEIIKCLDQIERLFDAPDRFGELLDLLATEIDRDLILFQALERFPIPLFDRVIDSRRFQYVYEDILYSSLDRPERIHAYLSLRDVHNPESRRLPVVLAYSVLNTIWDAVQSSKLSLNQRFFFGLTGYYADLTDPLPLILTYASPDYSEWERIGVERFLAVHPEYQQYYEPVERSRIL